MRVRRRVLSSETSHAILLGQFSICPENVGIATVRIQSLNNVEGNCMRHLWGTMRVCGVRCAGVRVYGCVVCRGRHGACRAWPGFEIDHSEPKARVWRSRGRAGPARAPGAGEAGRRPAGPRAQEKRAGGQPGLRRRRSRPAASRASGVGEAGRRRAGLRRSRSGLAASRAERPGPGPTQGSGYTP